MNAREQKIFTYAWFALTLLYLFLRYQNIPGVFSDVGIITIDTDPYYRLHRIRSIVQGSWFYPLFDPFLNYPKGFWVSWPLGLDYLIAAPLKILGIHDHSSILIVSFMAMPIITLPILFLTGSIAKKLTKNSYVTLAAGLFVTLINVLLQQTSVGRLDHHGLECLFVLLYLWFLIGAKSDASSKLTWMMAIAMGFAPSMYPHAWIPTLCLSMALMVEKDLKLLDRFSRIFFVGFCFSLIPLAFSDIFLSGEVRLTGFSWWSTWVLIGVSLWCQILIWLRTRKINNPNLFFLISGMFLSVCLFLGWKQGSMFLNNQVSDAMRLMRATKSTLSVTSEMTSPFKFDWDFLGEKILLLLMPVVYLWLIYRKKYSALLVYGLIPITLQFLQVRFMVPASGLMAILMTLFFWDLVSFLPAKRYAREALLFGLVMLVSSIYMPHLGMTNMTADSPYFQPIQHASIFLKNHVQKTNEDPKNSAVMASWDYGHWILFYSNLPVVATPFQGYTAVKSYEIFASENPQDLEDFEKEIPAKYMIVEQFPGRFYNVLEYAGKNPEDYFDFVKNPDGTYSKMSPKPSFDHVMYQRFLKNYGADDAGNLPSHWRLIYVSPYPAQYTKNAPALKVFEHVKGATIRTETKHSKLWLEINVVENGNIKTLRAESLKVGATTLEWTVPYSEYKDGEVQCDGIYKMIDSSGKVIGVLPTIKAEHVSKGEVLYVR